MGYIKKSLFKLSMFFIISVLLLTLTDLTRAQISNRLTNFDYPEIEVMINNNPSNDYLFLGLTAGGVGHLLIVDNEITPVFYRKIQGTIFSFQLQQNGELTYNIFPSTSFGMDSSGTPSNRFYTPGGFPFDFHELQVLEDGTYYVLGRENVTIDMSQYVPGGNPNATLITSTIHHMDSSDNEIWRWRSIEHYDILDSDDNVILTQSAIDWTHSNSIDVDADGNIYLSTRNFNEVTKIDRQTGQIIWRLGGKKNQFRFVNDNRGFSRQHDARRLKNGNLILFDNGVRMIPEYSSLVEYHLDEDRLIARLVNRFSRGDTVYSRIRGGVQELRNGNRLISWGENQNPSVTEFNPDGSVAFEIRFSSGAHQYRAFRFPWHTNLFSVSNDSVKFEIVSVGDSASYPITLYNYKAEEVLINEIFNREPAFSVKDSLPIVIPPYDSVEVTLLFKPYANKHYHDKINLRYVNNSLLLAQQVYVQGRTGVVSVPQDDYELVSYYLSQNYPNPFNPTTAINFQIPELSFVTLKVFDVLGNEIVTLVNEEKTAGSYEVKFKAANLPSAVYFYRLQTDSFVSSKKMLLLK